MFHFNYINDISVNSKVYYTQDIMLNFNITNYNMLHFNYNKATNAKL